MHQEKKTTSRNEDKVPEGAVPAYLLDREGQSRAKILSNMIKQKRKEKAVGYLQYSTLMRSLLDLFISESDLIVCDGKVVN